MYIVLHDVMCLRCDTSDHYPTLVPSPWHIWTTPSLTMTMTPLWFHLYGTSEPPILWPWPWLHYGTISIAHLNHPFFDHDNDPTMVPSPWHIWTTPYLTMTTTPLWYHLHLTCEPTIIWTWQWLHYCIISIAPLTQPFFEHDNDSTMVPSP